MIITLPGASTTKSIPLHMNGQLSEHPPVELIREIYSKGFSGTLRLEQERVRAAVYFNSGELTYAASNVRSLRLREYLIKHNLVSESQLQKLQQSSDLALLAELASADIIPSEVVSQVLKAQVTDVLRLVILWTQGSWNFDDRSRLDGSARVSLDISTLLIEASRRMDQSFILSRFGNPNELITPVAEAIEVSNLLPAEGFILSRIDAPISFNDLLAVSGLPELDVCRSIYTLALAGHLKREHWMNVFRERSSSRPRVMSKTPDAANHESVAEVSVGESKSNDQNELNRYLQSQWQARNHYEVLAVGTNSEISEIKRAYYDLARQYHPDRFRVEVSTKVHGQLESAFARVTQAYETLIDPKRRSAYDKALAAREQTNEIASPAVQTKSDLLADAIEPTESGKTKGGAENQQAAEQSAEESFKEGYAALKQGQSNRAISFLASAARLVPKEARYRAYYGKALAVHEKTRRLAESELSTAIKLDSSKSLYRVMLAELYLDLKFRKRAQAELERALAVEPADAEAKELLRRLKSGVI